jgi:Tfp pilus assembly protein PilV
MVEALMVAVILGIGLLGIAATQLTTIRGNAGSRARTVAVGLANSGLDRVLAEAKVIAMDKYLNQTQTPPFSITRTYTVDNAVPWVSTFNQDGNGTLTAAKPAFFTVTITRTALATPVPASALTHTFAFQGSVAWNEPGPGATVLPKSITLSRYVMF